MPVDFKKPSTTLPPGEQPASSLDLNFDGQNSRFSNVFNRIITGITLKEVLKSIISVVEAPAASLLIVGGTGRLRGASTAVTLNYTATKKTNPITSLVVAGQSIPPTGNTQSGSVASNANENVNTAFAMSVSDGALSANATQTLTWLNNRYWGRISHNAGITDEDIKALTGAGVGSGKELATSRVKTYQSINGAGDYLLFAWETTFGNPSFIVNGLPNTAFTKIRSNSPFANENNFVQNYDLWISNTRQNSPLTIQVN